MKGLLADLCKDMFESFATGGDHFVGFFAGPDIFEWKDVGGLCEDALADHSRELVEVAKPEFDTVVTAGFFELLVTGFQVFALASLLLNGGCDTRIDPVKLRTSKVSTCCE